MWNSGERSRGWTSPWIRSRWACSPRSAGPGRSAPSTSSTTRSSSLPALKAYLQGEQYFRRAEWDAAQRAFRARRGPRPELRPRLLPDLPDPVLQGHRDQNDSLMWSYALRAGELNRGLAPRESLMVAADSVLAAVSDAPALDAEAQRQRKRVIAILELANRRFPDDAEVWYQLGRARNRIGYLIGVQPEQALRGAGPRHRARLGFRARVRGGVLLLDHGERAGGNPAVPERRTWPSPRRASWRTWPGSLST